MHELELAGILLLRALATFTSELMFSLATSSYEYFKFNSFHTGYFAWESAENYPVGANIKFHYYYFMILVYFFQKLYCLSNPKVEKGQVPLLLDNHNVLICFITSF